MTPSEIIALSRLTTNTSTDIVTAVQAYTLLNIVVDDFWADITAMRTGYGQTTTAYNTTATSTYNLPTPTANTTLATSTFGLQKLEKAGIKYLSTQTNYTPVQLIYIDGILNLPDYYATGASTSQPIGLLYDTTIVIYPTPIAITNGLAIVYEQSHFPLGTTGSAVVTEDVAGCILIPARVHTVIVEGLNYRFYKVRGVDFTNVAVSQKELYESEKVRAINQLDNRNQEAPEEFTLNLDHLG